MKRQSGTSVPLEPRTMMVAPAQTTPITRLTIDSTNFITERSFFFLSKLFFTLSDEQKEVLYYLFVKQYSTARLAAIRGQSDRNIRKLRMTIQKKLQKRMYEHLSEKLENDHSLTLREREFVEEYEALLQTMGKDAVIRRENKTKPRKKKAALDDTKDG